MFLEKIRSRRWLYITLQILLVLVVFFGIQQWKLRDAIKGKAPMIRDQLITGESFYLKNFRQKPILVHFWATWCPICSLENSSIDSVADDYQVISIASWSEDNKHVADFMQQNNLDMPTIVDSDGEWARLYGVKAVPTSFFIDAQGDIRFIESGYTTEAGLRLRLWWLEN